MYKYQNLHLSIAQFKDGRWYAVEKFDTTQSKCITYDFQEDDAGFKELVQNSEITSIERLSVDNKFRYVGKLATPSTSNPANMLVRFQLSKKNISIESISPIRKIP